MNDTQDRSAPTIKTITTTSRHALPSCPFVSYTVYIKSRQKKKTLRRTSGIPFKLRSTAANTTFTTCPREKNNTSARWHSYGPRATLSAIFLFKRADVANLQSISNLLVYSFTVGCSRSFSLGADHQCVSGAVENRGVPRFFRMVVLSLFAQIIGIVRCPRVCVYGIIRTGRWRMSPAGTSSSRGGGFFVLFPLLDVIRLLVRLFIFFSVGVCHCWSRDARSSKIFVVVCTVYVISSWMIMRNFSIRYHRNELKDIWVA